MRLILALFILGFPVIALAQTPFGKWKTIDDDTGEAKSIVEIYQKDGKLYGKIADLLQKPNDTLCDKCQGDLKDKVLVGMDIIYAMEQDGDKYSEGEIMDPENGKYYDCKLWLDDKNTLKVRGYIGFFYRTQTWYRTE
ncbi:DUF2147 domain-containing protein [Thalassotalea agarivorans]|uniref:Uncharacterized conserved protein, DUF2147 family n=1 Tax=Thalassotalea agarivorans TaxID=349064 RepID=A0A1I0HN89_THASX|nr:DUF2147 domain-containing protein [Thalassotalea agarivorans]SET85524.1 Uncharacterized conserved protein, DUF2147 family [Thalassotalea agarivorans]